MAGVQVHRDALLALVRAGRVTYDLHSTSTWFQVDSHSIDSRDLELLTRLYAQGVIAADGTVVGEIPGADAAYWRATSNFGGGIRAVDRCLHCGRWVAQLHSSGWSHLDAEATDGRHVPAPTRAAPGRA